jgi:hypothetical protein
LKQDRNSLEKQSNRRTPLLLRLVAGAIAVAIAACEIVSFMVARSINLTYFKTSEVSVPSFDIAILVLGLYLLLFAISGRWRLYR